MGVNESVGMASRTISLTLTHAELWRRFPYTHEWLYVFEDDFTCCLYRSPPSAWRRVESNTATDDAYLPLQHLPSREPLRAPS